MDDRAERRRSQSKERAARLRARRRALAAASDEERDKLRAKWREESKKAYARERAVREQLSPEELEALRAKWREQRREAYAREKAGRELSPEEAEKFRAKWREKAKKAAALEAAGRAADAPERLREIARKRKEYRRLHQAKKYTDDLTHRLSVVLRSRLRSAVRNGQKRGSAIRDLGCTVDELKAHLERHFLPGMTWDKFGHGEGRWSIDHVFPMRRADLSDRAHVLAVCNWRNLRPEWFADNVRKSARVSREAKALFDGLVAHFRALETGSSGRAGRSSKAAHDDS